jgi:hypothetical protein
VVSFTLRPLYNPRKYLVVKGRIIFKCILDNYVRMDVREIRSEVMYWIHLAQIETGGELF